MPKDRTGYKLSQGRNRGLRRPPAGGDSPADKRGESLCETRDNGSSASTQSSAVSRAISQAVPPSNGREKPTIETNDAIRESCNQSRGEPEQTVRPNCYECVYRGGVPGSAHSSCHHPSVKPLVDHPLGQIMGIVGKRMGGMGPLESNLNVSGDPHGIRSGWFNWPFNFDPVWLKNCNGFKRGGHE